MSMRIAIPRTARLARQKPALPLHRILPSRCSRCQNQLFKSDFLGPRENASHDQPQLCILRINSDGLSSTESGKFSSVNMLWKAIHRPWLYGLELSPQYGVTSDPPLEILEITIVMTSLVSLSSLNYFRQALQPVCSNSWELRLGFHRHLRLG